MPTRVRSHAKINLGLGIGAPRSDGFHALCTVYQTLELHDIVTVEAKPAAATTIRLTSNDERVPTDARNTAWKMVELALQHRSSPADVSIHIEKHLPIQGGLGAGSANAIAALVGVEVELTKRHPNPSSWLNFRQFAEKMGVPEPGMPFNGGTWPVRELDLASKVGSDVPLFLVGGTILGRDRGQAVFPLPDLEPTWCVIAAPAVGVSTPQAFRDWDSLCIREGLTADASDDRLEKLSRAYAEAFARREGSGSSGVFSSGEDLAGPQESALVRTGITSWIENDFERVVFPQQPILSDIKRILAASGTPEAALYASLSGSGSALYGLYQSRSDAEAAQVRLAEQVKEIQVRSMMTRTIPRSAYWSEMLL
jgi:4-diphosphocytidyl-2-C-methyl-D-erythritol kinase